MNRGLLLSTILFLSFQCVLLAQVNTVLHDHDHHDHDHFTIPPPSKKSEHYKQKVQINELAIAKEMVAKKSFVSLPFHSGTEEFTKEEFKYYDGDVPPVKGIRAYRLFSKNNPLLEGRLVSGPAGVNIMYLDGTGITRIYYEKSASGQKEYYQEHGCGATDTPRAGCSAHHSSEFTPGDILTEVTGTKESITKSFGKDKRVFRVAIVTTGEYYTGNGNSKNAVEQKAIQNLVDISFIYEREINVFLVQAINSPRADYNDPDTDPFNFNSGDRTTKAQEIVSDRFPNENNYDIGHVFHNHRQGTDWLANGGGNGGLALPNSVCRDGSKANGWSGAFSNDGNAFIALAAHEFGHQFGCPHTFNGGENENCNNAIEAGNNYEIGSGITIMSYNGTCGDGQNILGTVQDGGHLEDPAYNFFLAVSLEQMKEHLLSSVASSCNIDGWTIDNNTIPVADANPCGAVYSIPTSTSFFLRGEGTDADGDTLLYAWEQFDSDASLDTQGDIGTAAANNTVGPIFRCFPPNGNPVRHFPRRSSQLEGFNSDVFEVLPRRARRLNFRFLVRDNAHAGGAVDWDQINMNVVSSSFGVTSPSSGDAWESGTTSPVVRWETDGAEAICDRVDIKLSIDGGSSFPIFLKRNTSFSAGSTTIDLPEGIPATAEARIMVLCADYECFGFYDMSDPITITSACDAQATAVCNLEPITVDFRDPQLNFGTMGAVGSTLTNIEGEVDPGGPTLTTVLWNSQRNGCATLNNSGNGISTIQFSPTRNGQYYFDFPEGSRTIDVHSIFEKETFNASNPCLSFVASNARRTSGSNYAASDYMYVDLEACKEYYLISQITQNNNFDIDIKISAGSGSLVGANTISSSIAYIAVDSNNGNIAAQNSDGDFTTIDPGTYTIHSVAYESANPSSWIGQTIDQIALGSECLVVSDNFKPVTINASCAIVNPTATLSASCDPLSNEYAIDLSFEIDRGPTTGQGFVDVVGYPEIETFEYTVSSGVLNLTLAGLPSDGQPLDLRFSFQNDDGCIKIEQGIFVAPENCCPIQLDLGDQRLCEGETATLDAGTDGNIYEWSLDGDPLPSTGSTLPALLPGTYRVTVTDANGCSKTDETTVSFSVPPAITVETEDVTDACEGERIPLQVFVLNFDSIAWYRDGTFLDGPSFVNRQRINIFDPGQYEVKAFNGGCERSEFISVSLLPITPFTLGEDIVECVGATVALDPGLPDLNWEWFELGTTTIFSTDDTYTIMSTSEDDAIRMVARGTGDNGCPATDTIRIDFKPGPEIDLGEDQEDCDTKQLDVRAGFQPVDWYVNGELIIGFNNRDFFDVPDGLIVATGFLGSCVSSDTVLITKVPGPVVDLGPNMSFCEGTPIDTVLYVGEPFDFVYQFFVNGSQLPETSGLDGTLEVTEPMEVFVEVKNRGTNKCTSTDEIIIEYVSNPEVEIIDSPFSICEENGTATITASSSSDGLAWLLDGELTNFTEREIEVTKPGTYTIVVGLDQQCEVSDEVTVLAEPSPELNLPSEVIGCIGNPEMLEASQNTTYTYEWLLNGIPISGANTGSYLAEEAGIYEIIATNSVPCESRDTVVVRFDGASSVMLPDDETLCDGEPFTINAVTSAGNLSWYNGTTPLTETGKSLEVSSAGIYIAIAQEGEDCEARDSIIITTSTAPVVMLSDVTVCQGKDAEFIAGPDDGFDYQWYINGDPISNQSGTLILDSEDIDDLTAEIAVDVKNENDDCSSSSMAVVTFTAGATLEITPPLPPYCQGSSLMLETMTNQTSLIWSRNGQELPDTDTVIEIFESGEYIANAGSGTCSAADTINITFGAAPVFAIETQSVCQDEDAEFDAGNADYSYQWFLGTDDLGESGSMLTVMSGQLPSGMGEIRVVATDSGTGCTADTTVVIEFISTPTLTLEPPEMTCNGFDAIITANIVGASSLEWTFEGDPQTETGTSFTATASGTYTAKAGSGDCAVTESLDLSFTDAPSFAIEKQSVCEGEDAFFDAGNDDYSYQWFLDTDELVETSSTLTVTEAQLPAKTGEVRVIATDRTSGCTADTTVVIEFISTPTLTLEPPEMTCNGFDAIITANLVGASSLEWTFEGDPQTETGTSFTATESGTYTAKAGSGDCAVTESLDLTFTDAPSFAIEKQSVCEGQDAVFDAGTDDYNYQWFLDTEELVDTGSILIITEAQLPSKTGEVRVIATDRISGCTADTTVVIEFISTPTLTLEPPEMTCNGFDAIITANLVGASTLEWTFEGDPQSETGTSFTATQSGTYTAKAGSGDCAVTQSLDLTFTDSPSFEIEKQSVCEGEDAFFDAGTGNDDYSYQWFLDTDELGETSSTLTVTEAQLPAKTGEVRVIATDRTSGCTADTTVVIEFISTPTLTLEPPEMTCNGFDAIITANLVGASSLEWTFEGDPQSETGTSFTATESGTYTARAGSGDCAVTQSLDLTFTDSPFFEIEKQSVCEGEDAFFDAGNDDYSYQWFLDSGELMETGSTLTITEMQLPAKTGEVSVIATDRLSGCTSDTMVVIEFIATPTLTLEPPEKTCNGFDAIITANLVGATSLEWTFEGDPQSETGTSFTATASGTYTARAGSGDCAVTQSLDLSFTDSPSFEIEKQSVCQGQNAFFDAGTDDYNYQWFLGTEELMETGSTLAITEAQLPAGNGEVSVIATDAMSGCTSDTMVIIEFIATPTLTIDEPATACEGMAVDIEANLVGASSLEWTLDGTTLSETGTTLSVTDGGTYTATAGSGMCAVTESITVEFDPLPNVDIGSDVAACEGTPVEIDLTADNTDNISWLYSPDGTNPEVIMGQSGETISVDQEGFYSVNVTSDEGCSSEESVEVIYIEFPNGEGITDLPMGICAGTPFEVIADSEGDSFFWSDQSGPITGATGISQVFSQTGNYVFTALNSYTDMETNETTECPVEYPFSLDFIPAPEVDLQGDQRVCEGEPVVLSIQSMPDVTYEWYLGDVLQNEDGNSFDVTVAGEYELVVTNDIDCSNSDVVNIEFVSIPVITTSTDVSFCSGEVETLAITTDAPIITWRRGNEVVGQNVQTIDISEGGTYTVEASTPEGCSVIETIEVTEISVASIELEDGELCPGDDPLQVTIDGDFDTYVWSGGATGTSATISIPYQEVTSLTTETITVEARKGDCPSSTSFTVTYFPIIAASVANDNIELCEGEDIQLEVSGGSIYQWTDPNGSLSNTNVSNPTASPIETTTYEVMISDVCPNSFETLSVLVTVYPLPNADAGEDKSTIPDKPINLEGSGGVSYEWDNSDLINGSSSIAEPEVSIEEPTTFTVTVTDENGCSATDTVLIDIVNDPEEVIEVVDAFSPNDDGNNDVLEFRGLELFPVNKLVIFNRWGNVVFEKRNYQNDQVRWDGTRNGEQLPAGTYYYILEFDSLKVKNSLTLVRE